MSEAGYKAPLPLFHSSSKIPSVQPASAHQRTSTTATYNPQHIPPTAKMPGAVVGNATRIWELNVHWDLYSQCGIWDARGRGVDIWECIQPPTKRTLLAICRPKIVLVFASVCWDWTFMGGFLPRNNLIRRPKSPPHRHHMLIIGGNPHHRHSRTHIPAFVVPATFHIGHTI
ncbi:hypothetical protein D9613_010105 [Agrocybe pediades]|uniref:Uncharacterized protein n=1 Tax=Agrocybe pediades TaxID=84607 RepID=A0A8H4VSF4_9AGAR|nr:hypothetical protein D9613_010105 [Agrocybe pediades]